MIDLGPGSEAVNNAVMMCNTVADSYPESIAHGLQKDAIQNSLDARKSRKSTVCVEFSVAQNQRGQFLIFTDSNTVGLTGDVKKDISDYANLGQNDHWARFESFGYTKDDPDALGARGQGKFIFLQTSKDYRMFYDTLREDGIYRLGATHATKTGRTVYPERGEKWEDDVAKSKLLEHCGLKPLREIGTRIIICEPRKEVLDEIYAGAFVAAIQETWFRAIEKQQLEVRINAKGKSSTVGLQNNYPLPDRDSGKIKTWIYKKDFDESVISDDFKIKNFRVAYLPETDIPDTQRGVAILQGGMKIVALDMEIAPSEIKQHVTGFIEFDRLLDQELRKGHNQHPNHYQLKWRSRVPRGIKAFIQRQLQEFGRRKLGIGEDRRQRQQLARDNAEREAMEMLLRYARDLDLGRYRTKRSSIPPVLPPPPPPPPHKECGTSIAVQFPDIDKKPRVDLGEQMLVSASCFNKTTQDISGKFSTRVLQGDAVIEELVDIFLAVPANSIDSRTVSINGGYPFVITFDQSVYKKPGEYRVRATLTDSTSGDRIDVVTRRFWLGENPPRQYPFNLQAASLQTKHAWQPGGDIEHDPTIYYNTNHPEFKHIQDDEQAHSDYLLNICLKGALHFILTRPTNESGAPDYHPLDTAEIVGVARELVPEKVYEQISHYKAKVRWRMHEE